VKPRRRSLVVADCETTPFKIGRVPMPFIWGYYDGLKYRQFPATLKEYLRYAEQAKTESFNTFDSSVADNALLVVHRDALLARLITKDFITFLKQQHVICYAHNGGKFDWHFILPELMPYDDIMIINGRIAKCFVGMCECRDSYNILPVPLSAYKKDDIDYNVMENENRTDPKNWEDITSYLRGDCVYLHELVSGFVDKYGMQITQASAAMSQWKRVSKRKTPTSSKDFYEIFAPYYYGGRVQCFRAGIIETDFAVYDINSAYPYAMLHNHPYSTDYIRAEGYIANADFYRIECVSNGAFPFRGLGTHERAAGLWFPHDNELREYTVTGWEYSAAVDTQSLRGMTVKESFVFNERVDFADYINYFYEMRLKAKAEKNEAESLFAKLLMNSLYGKFASNPENYRNYMIVPMDVIAGLESEGWSFSGELGPWGLAEAPLPENEQRYYNVATAASITGFVRAMLWRAIHSSKGVLYCDTDSIAVEGKGSAVSLGERLGQWKHEGNFDRAGIAGKKLYIFQGKPDAKGERAYKTASKGARLANDQLWEVAAGAQIYHYAEVPTFSIKKAPVFTNRRIKRTA
jgi:hypothetical protein